MAEGGPGRGRGGRGLIIAKLLERERKPGQQPPDPPAGDGPSTSQETIPPQQPPQKPIGGRGAMFQRIQQKALETKQPPELPITHLEPSAQQLPSSTPLQPSTEQPSSTAQIPLSRGRGRFFMSSEIQPQPVQSSPTTTPSQPTTPAEPDVRSVTRQMRRIEIASSQPPVVMRGTDGKEVPATANYIPLYLKEGRGIYEFEVRFSPEIDDKMTCEHLLFVQHRDILGRHRTFDGVTLYVPHKLEDTSLTSTHPVTGEIYTISLIYKRERSMGECIHMYNLLFNNIQRELNLVKLGREYFSQDLRYTIPQHKIEVWPGYITAVDAFEGGIMLNCNNTTKVLRTQTVLDIINDVVYAHASNWKDTLLRMLIGQSVMTRNPVRMYRIDDIDFTQNPQSTFQKADGTTMTYVEYHVQKSITIKDLRQPLLLHKQKERKRPNGSAMLLLIPELCYMTGLTDEMRNDFKIMKDIATYTRVNPNQKQRALQTFIDNIRSTPTCVKLLDEWGLKVPDRTVDLTARILNQECLFFGRNYVDHGSTQADWTRSATREHMLETVDIHSWLVVHTQKDQRYTKDFVEMMLKICPQMGVRVQHPDIEPIRDDRTETYLKVLRNVLSEKIQLVVVIFPSARDDRYSAIKKMCCVDRPIPSQVINSKTISRPERLRSIVQKIALQINCKLGGALWAVKIPFKNAMICGVDTYHDSKNRGQSVAAFISSMNPSVTRWYSQVFIQSSDREMVDGLRLALCTALNKYYEVNKQHPDTVIIFRDGVGDGQLKVCQEHEVQALRKAFDTVSPDYQPALAFIVCQKRINTRIFIPMGNSGFENPSPGSVVDHSITRRYWYDFFLISQFVRQGTVTPTHYVVIHNTTQLNPDKMQKLTYKMCHLYYNWTGTVRVPAPCQYAHKLANLIGLSIHKEPAQVLCDRLFFL